MSKIKFEDLLGTGAHFGHVTRKWNPNYKPFVLMEKNGIHIINLDQKRVESFYLLELKNRLEILFNKKRIDALCSM